MGIRAIIDGIRAGVIATEPRSIAHVGFSTRPGTYPTDPYEWAEELRHSLRDFVVAIEQYPHQLAEIELMVRLELSPRGLTEDDFPAPQRLRDVLLDLAGSHILRLTQREDADRLRELAMERFDRVMRATPWVDADQDGAVDPGEVAPAAQDWGRDFRWSAPSTTTRRFSIGGSH